MFVLSIFVYICECLCVTCVLSLSMVDERGTMWVVLLQAKQNRSRQEMLYV